MVRQDLRSRVVPGRVGVAVPAILTSNLALTLWRPRQDSTSLSFKFPVLADHCKSPERALTVVAQE
ncbi:hypothetical protein E2C01_033033 [Portunus trituberculatus]|uniref:Uncharacterized protein n=1 Tax=Portunus trituberculatus TaxID=210409 RepID=A0A5B7F4J9_PORTR|nr:hypothetical protein [Portunus trituberculatus]